MDDSKSNSDLGSSHLSEEDAARLRLISQHNIYAPTSEADLQILLASEKEAQRILVVDYYAPWCRACRRLLNLMHKMALEDRYRNVDFASVDFEHARELCRKHDIEKLPTMEIYSGGEISQRWVGASKKRLAKEGKGGRLAQLLEVAKAKKNTKQAFPSRVVRHYKLEMAEKRRK